MTIDEKSIFGLPDGMVVDTTTVPVFVPKTAEEIVKEIRSAMDKLMGEHIAPSPIVDVIAESISRNHFNMLYWARIQAPIEHINITVHIDELAEPKRAPCHCEWIKKVSEGYNCIDCDHQRLAK